MSLHPWGDPLKPADIEQHRRLSIPPELLEAAGVRRVNDQQAREVLNLDGRHGNLAGILYPRLHPLTKGVVGYRVRRDAPELEDGKPKDKYLSPYRDPHRLYFAPQVTPLLADTSVPVVIVEAEKSALAATAATARRGTRRLLPI